MGCRLMVGQEILVLFIMVRIRAPQPIFKRTLVVRFNIVLCGHGSQSATTVAGSTMSRFDKHSAIKSSGMPRRRYPRELSAPQPHFASTRRSEWQATQGEKHRRSSVHRSLGVVRLFLLL